MFQSPATSSPYQVSDIVSDLKHWWETCPLFSKFLIYSCSFLTIVAVFDDSLPNMFANQPDETLGKFEITRLIFSPFVHFSIAEVLLAFIAYLPMLSLQEKMNGTLFAFIDFLFKNIEANLLFVLVCYILSSVHNDLLGLQSHGLWVIFFVHLVEKCMEDLESTSPILCLPFHIKNKLYPLVLLVAFSLVSHKPRIDLIVAAITGFINFKVINNFYVAFLNSERIANWETSSVITFMKTLPNYVSHGSMSGPLIQHGDNNVNPNYPPIGVFSPTEDKMDIFGGAGTKVGGNGDANAKPAQKSQNYANMGVEFEDLEMDQRNN